MCECFAWADGDAYLCPVDADIVRSNAQGLEETVELLRRVKDGDPTVLPEIKAFVDRLKALRADMLRIVETWKANQKEEWEP